MNIPVSSFLTEFLSFRLNVIKQDAILMKIVNHEKESFHLFFYCFINWWQYYGAIERFCACEATDRKRNQR